MYSFSYLEPVCCSMSSSNCFFLICIQISQVVWDSYLLKNFPQFVVIHRVKGFGIVNKAETDIFLNSLAFLRSSEFGNKEFIIWATVNSWSLFCWLYRNSLSLAVKNIINLISGLTIWWCPCVEPSLVVGRGCLLWPVCSLGKTLLAFALLHSVLQGQICLLLQVSLDFLLLHSSPL